MPNIKKKRNIVHLILWILSCVAAGLVSDLTCFKCEEHYCRNQFIDATVFGYLIVACLLLGAIIFDEDIPEKTLYLLCAGGAVLYLITAALLLITYNDQPDWISDEFKSRVLADGIFTAILGLLYLIELIISLAKKDLLEGSV